MTRRASPPTSKAKKTPRAKKPDAPELKVISINREKHERNGAVVAVLKRMLREAQQGDMTGLAIATASRDNATGTVVVFPGSPSEIGLLFLAVERLHFRLLHEDSTTAHRLPTPEDTPP